MAPTITHIKHKHHVSGLDHIKDIYNCIVCDIKPLVRCIVVITMQYETTCLNSKHQDHFCIAFENSV